MENRPLTLDQVLALPNGAEVWVELRPEIASVGAGVHTLTQTCSKTRALVDAEGEMWPLYAGSVMGVVYRVWSLPRPPTAEELAKWPWEEDAK